MQEGRKGRFKSDRRLYVEEETCNRFGEITEVEIENSENGRDSGQGLTASMEMGVYRYPIKVL